MVELPNTKDWQNREAYFFGLALTIVMAITSQRSQIRPTEVESMSFSELLEETMS